MNSKIDIFIGMSLSNVYKDFYQSENEEIPTNVVDEESDGRLFLKFTNGDIYSFDSCPEMFSIKIDLLKRNYNLKKISSKIKEITFNSFWEGKINRLITDVKFLESYGHTYGINFFLEDQSSFSIMYLSETEFTFDVLVAREGNGLN